MRKPVIFLLVLTMASTPAWCHVVVAELENLSRTDAFWLYLKLGFQHILPAGLDHILFVVGLFLLSPRLKPILWQSAAFTIAHSITLGLAMYKVVAPPASIIEPLIALSILFVALENIFFSRLKPARIGLIFLFGLVHGLGFASSLGELGLPRNAFLTSLITFNLGVEIGQLTVILLMYFLIGKWFRDKPFYRKTVVIPLSLLIALMATYWTVERIFYA